MTLMDFLLHPQVIGYLLLAAVAIVFVGGLIWCKHMPESWL